MTTGCGGSAVNNTICQLRIPQNRRSGPENGIFHDGAFLHAAILAYPGVRDGSVYSGGGMDFRSHAKAGLQISFACAEIEPPGFAFDVIGAELASFDQFEKGGNDGDFFIGGNEIENFGINAIDSGELVGAR